MNNETKQTLDISGGTGMPLEALDWHGAALKQEPPIPIEFRKSGEWVMRITADHRIEVNEGVDVTEAAQTVLEALQKLMQPKPWVSLTDDEIKEIVGPWGDIPIKGYTRELFYKIDEALRRKNHD